LLLLLLLLPRLTRPTTDDGLEEATRGASAARQWAYRRTVPAAIVWVYVTCMSDGLHATPVLVGHEWAGMHCDAMRILGLLRAGAAGNMMP
jgi:hypothetical protein